MKMISTQFRSALLFACALAVAGCSQLAAVNNQNAAPPGVTEPAAAAASQNPEDKMLRVNAQDAIKAAAEGKAVIIDVRGTESYKLAHIKDALDHGLQRVETGDFNGLPKDKQIIAYCT
ncbi:MAG: rhodanese-like domain-containing protein [Blastocatellia bacterium]|nr:rhodanese-like domain-containing protein [Blastocatellia bacterium]